MQDDAPEQARPTTVGDDAQKTTPANVRYGKGWATLDTSGYSWRPGVHDIGAALGLTSATMLLVVLLAAESWAPESEDVTQPDAIICREGRVLVEFTDGSTQQLDRDAELLPNTRPPGAGTSSGSAPPSAPTSCGGLQPDCRLRVWSRSP